MRRILVPRMDEVVGEWRKLHSEKLQHFYSSPNIVAMKSKGMRWVDSVACMGEKRSEVFIEKHEGKRPLGRPLCRWECNIKIYIERIRWEAVDWFHLA